MEESIALSSLFAKIGFLAIEGYYAKVPRLIIVNELLLFKPYQQSKKAINKPLTSLHNCLTIHPETYTYLCFVFQKGVLQTWGCVFKLLVYY